MTKGYADRGKKKDQTHRRIGEQDGNSPENKCPMEKGHYLQKTQEQHAVMEKTHWNQILKTLL